MAQHYVSHGVMVPSSYAYNDFFQSNEALTLVNRTIYRTRSVQYRDIDLGSRREAIYADTLVDLSDNDQILDSNFGLSSWGLSYSGQDEEFLHEVLSGTDISRWKDLQHTISQPREDRSARATYYEPLPPLSIIDENVQEDSSRPTTSSTNRRDSGEFLRCLQTSSSLASMLHSRNVSEASAITLPSSKDDYELRTAPGGEGPSKLDRLSLCEAENLRSTYASVVVQSHFDHGMGQDVVDTDDVFEDNVWLQAPMYQEPESYEEEDNFEYDFHGSMVLNTEEAQVANNRRKCDEELYFDHQSQKSLCLHVEQSAAGEDDQSYSYSSQTPNGREEVVTRSYGKFDAAFTQQIKDYSKLLDDLADPDATEQALELVSRRLSIYLNTNSSADSGFGRPFETEIPHEKRQLMDLSGLDAFLDDDDDDDEEYSDSGFQAAGGGGSITRIFACPAQPQSTPFFDLEQFIDDDDLDFDMGSGGPDKPVTNGFDDWESSVDGDV